MTAANWLTLAASVVALLSVILSYRMNKKQLENANRLALKQIDAAAAETSRRLKAEVLLKDKQNWIKEFRETIIELLHLGDPSLDDIRSASNRVEQITRLAHKVDLMLPVGTSHAALARAIAEFADLLSHVTRGSVPPYETQRRLFLASQITIFTREILKAELASVEANL